MMRMQKLGPMMEEIKKKYANNTNEENLAERLRNYLEKGEKLGIKFPERVLKYS